ncbi:GGDEF domain-containing protein [Stutzerimonas xanthomarina]|uniref:diguanylate cyclase n=2 Tax=Stutzerimonas xanthomarina TaxID=271420 RepID=A0A1M5L2C5_9GAMM|nr:GGDEF domain-containing protein [Stutzerimonas xanthomarina]MCP9337440.1 GGDEF domain-containing protein [Stutzerimonas xanthomarina]SEH50394.1 diguanylate cyclase [Stutzerimonas xanthomarina]SHG59141.1 diguanylate cyclase [Stutzerimonas xanthomarina DSM 18231]
MSDDAQRWKDKYLHQLEQQEQLEGRWNTRLDLLRRSLVRSSFAVDDADPAVERCMRELRDVLRDDVQDNRLGALVPRLERAVLDTERSKQERLERLTEALDRLTSQLLELPLPSEIRKPLKQFSRQLDERAAQSRELPRLLAELGELQSLALSAQRSSAGTSSVGLLGRLFGQRERAIKTASKPDDDSSLFSAESVESLIQQPEAPSQPLDTADCASQALQAAIDIAGPHREAVIDVTLPELAAENQPNDSYRLPPSPEQAYSAISERVESTLFGLLEDLHLPEHQQAQAQALRDRIQRGLNWYELVPVLDDLAQLMLAVADQGQREFESYLSLLNERLATMQDSLFAAREGHVQSKETAQALDEELRQQVGGLQDSMLGANDLPSLKQTVQSRLDGLLETVDAYQRQRSEHEQALSDRLGTLVERVANLEKAATGMREHLEEQRQKALQDPLTGLPNRAAWDERLQLEVARHQRYGGQLLLAVLDVDHFKRINDSFGHLAGDRVLKIIASELRKRLRKTDFIARFGGEEFALLLPETPAAAGLQLLDSLRTGIERCPFHFKGAGIQVTLSGGLASFAAADRGEQVFERADRALYRAKDSGRNRIEAD